MHIGTGSKPGMASSTPVKSPTQMKGQLDKKTVSSESVMDSMKKSKTTMKGQN